MARVTFNLWAPLAGPVVDKTPPPVQDVRLDDARSAAQLVRAWGASGGFVASKVARAASIVQRMLEDDTQLWLSFPAAPMATGMRGLVTDLVREGHVDAILTTCGTLDHDIARTVADYRQGAFDLDDEEVADRGFHRLGSVLVPEGSYGPLIEEVVRPVLEAQGWEEARVSGTEICRVLGQRLAQEPAGESSLLAACADQAVPVFVPGFTDGSVGSQLWSWYETRRGFQLDLLADEHQLSQQVHEADRLGAIMVGGGISKHHAIWWAQFRNGLDDAVYITTAPEHDGSLSGARMREAISWHKMKPQAGHTTVEGDATVLLPLILGAALADR